ncbi:Coiled-coil domain-containing protein 63 [Phytophthora pseudosyringae]|uniref:Coiled-coil domain-containing protein 63 n=1 Tax=Phytophthora pseudosyringae TaxID=221518 RepID=A0A8T1VZ99_9STRA|nr:Coiled-coil domain-containing protein 63 [Phytophthora pseudosyringae]
MSNPPPTGGATSNMFSPRSTNGGSNRYHLATSGARTPRVFPPDVHSVPLSPSRLESPMFRERVTALMHQGDTYAKRLDTERRRSVDLDAALRALRVEHFQARKALCTATNAQLCAATSDLKPIRTLENRLDKVLTRYNEVCNANKALREQIQALRREKVQQAAVLDKLERETVQAQGETSQVTQASQAAGDARDRANRQSEALRNQLAEDGTSFESGWVEKTGQLADDRAMIRDIPRLRTPKSPSRPHFLNSATTPASMSSPLPSNTSGRSLPGGFKLLSTPDIKLRDETQKNERLLHEKANDLQKQSERLRIAQDGLAKIKRKTGEKDSHDLAAALISAEEKNFSLFNMINELNTEMEALEVENNALEAQVNEQTRDGSMGSAEDARRRALKQQLEDQIEKSRQKVARLEARHSEAAEAAEVMKAGAMGLFHKLQGPNDEAFALQLSTHGVTDVTMAQLLGLIEQRVGELVDIHNIATNAPAAAALGAQHPAMKVDVGGHDSAHTRHSRNDERPRGGGAASATGVLLRPAPPTAEDFGDSDNDEPQQDDVLRPCKISDIQEKTAAAVGRRKEKQIRAKR